MGFLNSVAPTVEKHKEDKVRPHSSAGSSDKTVQEPVSMKRSPSAPNAPTVSKKPSTSRPKNPTGPKKPSSSCPSAPTRKKAGDVKKRRYILAGPDHKLIQHPLYVKLSSSASGGADAGISKPTVIAAGVPPTPDQIKVLLKCIPDGNQVCIHMRKRELYITSRLETLKKVFFLSGSETVFNHHIQQSAFICSTLIV